MINQKKLNSCGLNSWNSSSGAQVGDPLIPASSREGGRSVSYLALPSLCCDCLWSYSGRCLTNRNSSPGTPEVLSFSWNRLFVSSLTIRTSQDWYELRQQGQNPSTSSENRRSKKNPGWSNLRWSLRQHNKMWPNSTQTRPIWVNLITKKSANLSGLPTETLFQRFSLKVTGYSLNRMLGRNQKI